MYTCISFPLNNNTKRDNSDFFYCSVCPQSEWFGGETGVNGEFVHVMDGLVEKPGLLERMGVCMSDIMCG